MYPSTNMHVDTIHIWRYVDLIHPEMPCRGRSRPRTNESANDIAFPMHSRANLHLISRKSTSPRRNDSASAVFDPLPPIFAPPDSALQDSWDSTGRARPTRALQIRCPRPHRVEPGERGGTWGWSAEYSNGLGALMSKALVRVWSRRLAEGTAVVLVEKCN